ncbi:phthiocerol/phthiodiolone dimycocerosyl transferase family protein [Amycolatopsis sp. 3B14]|uniref:phthiocerol/phthiodiolone dimycocerosyl transferase family protein n=1 Tax=Amycolatopsis sp. 3B14 TaxID=3243600 RepID=UPI003D99254E
MHARYLDTIEYQAMDMPSAVVLRYSGELEEKTLTDSFRILGRRRAALRSRIRATGQGFELYLPDDDPAPEVVWQKGYSDNEFEQPSLEDLCKTAMPWDVEEAVAKLTVFAGKSGGIILMHTDHAIADGQVKLAFLREFLTIYRDLSGGGQVDSTVSYDLPSPPSAVLAGRLGIEAPKGHPTPAHAPAFTKHEALRHYITLTEQQTLALRKSAKRAGTSVHAFLCGVILRCHRRDRGDALPSSKMFCWAPVHLRPRVSPIVTPPETTNFVGIHTAPVEVGIDDDIAEIGRKVKQQLDGSIADQDIHHSFLTDSFRQDEVEDLGSGNYLDSISLSNLGRLPEFTCPVGTRFTDFQIFTHRVMAPYPCYVTYNYAGRLTIQCVYRPDLHSRADAERYVTAISAELDDITRERPGER